MLLAGWESVPCAPVRLPVTEAEACPPRRSGAGVGQHSLRVLQGPRQVPGEAENENYPALSPCNAAELLPDCVGFGTPASAHPV